MFVKARLRRQKWSVGVVMAKIAAVKWNTGSCPPILPASGNEQGLWHSLWKKRWGITGACVALSRAILDLSVPPEKRPAQQKVNGHHSLLKDPNVNSWTQLGGCNTDCVHQVQMHMYTHCTFTHSHTHVQWCGPRVFQSEEFSHHWKIGLTE